MDYRPAEVVRLIGPDEVLSDLINEAKADTWTKGREHAVLVLQGHEFVLVRGGYDGIILNETDGLLTVGINGVDQPILKLAWHVHPKVTGPSDFDRRLLSRLGQGTSVVYEIGGEKRGTIFPAMPGGK